MAVHGNGQLYNSGANQEDIYQCEETCQYNLTHQFTVATHFACRSSLFCLCFPLDPLYKMKKRKSSLVLLEMMLHIIDHHHALHKLSALQSRTIHNRKARL